MEEPVQAIEVKQEEYNKYNKLWYIESIKNGEDYQIKKVSEHKKEVMGYNPDTNKIVLKEGAELNIFKTFKDAAIVAIGHKISKKKEKWDNMIEDSYKLNLEIGDLVDKLKTLRGD